MAGYSPRQRQLRRHRIRVQRGSNQLTATIWPIGPPPNGWQPAAGGGIQGVAVDTSTNTIFATREVGCVAVIDGRTNTIVDTVDGVGNPPGVAANSVTHAVYAVSADGYLAVLMPVSGTQR